MISGNYENTPIRRIAGKAELLGGSATLACGNEILLNDIYPVPHDIKISAESENLINPYGITATTGYGTASVDGNNIVITPNASGTYYAINLPSGLCASLVDGVTYTFSMDSISAHGGNWGWRIRYKDGTYNQANQNTSITITWEENLNALMFYIGMPYTSSNPVTITNLQCRKANTVLPFIPYVDTSNTIITATGRNLMVVNDFEVIGSSMNTYCRDGILGRVCTYSTGVTTSWVAGASFGLDANNFANPYLQANKTYILTAEWVSIPTSYASKKIYLEVELEDGTVTNWYSGAVLTPTQTAKIISVRCESLSVKYGEHMAVRLQVELGTEAHPYEKAFTYNFTQSGVITEKVNNLYITTATGLLDNTYLSASYLRQFNRVFTASDDLQSITVDRAGINKFFGYGVCAKGEIKIRDKERAYNITENCIITVSFNDMANLPWLYITNVNREETTNTITVTAYDLLYNAEKHTVSELGLNSYTISQFITACGKLLGVDVIYPSAANEFNLMYTDGANFDGTETIRAALDAVAEVTQTIYYMNSENKLTFVRLDKFGDAVYNIDKSQYFTLNSKEKKVLGGICHTTELGDSVSAIADENAELQYIRDNPFWELRDDIGTLVENALTTAKDYSINKFDCVWRGNYLLEVGDKISLVTKDNKTITAYLLNDTITYNGGYKQVTKWDYTDTEKTNKNPSTIGEAIKQTYARVDKVNKQIDLVASESNANSAAIAALQINTDSISASVSSLETQIDENTNTVAELSKRVNATMTDEEINIAIESKLNNGVSSVETSTGFTFNENGLTVAKSDSNITTTITEDGMQVAVGEDEVLVANNEGVTAIDLKANTYLVIASNSRFENYNNGSRTACFWVGG